MEVWVSNFTAPSPTFSLSAICICWEKTIVLTLGLSIDTILSSLVNFMEKRVFSNCFCLRAYRKLIWNCKQHKNWKCQSTNLSNKEICIATRIFIIHFFFSISLFWWPPAISIVSRKLSYCIHSILLYLVNKVPYIVNTAMTYSICSVY